MKLIDNVKKNEMIDWARQIEKIVRENDEEIAKSIDEQIKSLDDHKLTIAVIGLLKRGKSTFCNAFLERKDDMIAPIDRFPATGVITEFMYSDREYAKVIFENTSAIEISYKDIRSYATEELNPENKKNVQKIEVYGKFPLDPEIKLVDMPGDDSIHLYHSEIVYNYLPNADVIIFLSSANDPISVNELNLLRKVNENDMKKVFFVINKIDKCDYDEFADAKNHAQITIASSKIKIENEIYAISAKKALDGDWETSNFNKLLSNIKDFLNTNRYNLLLNAFYGRILSLSHPIMQKLQQQNKFESMSVEELEEKIEELEGKKIIMLDEFNEATKEFSQAWDDMLDEFEMALPEIEKKIENNVVPQIEATSRFGINKKFILKVQEQISNLVENEFQIASGALEKKAIAALDKLNKSCPEITKFISEQSVISNPSKNEMNFSMGGWVITLLSGASLYLSGSAIVAAFGVGSTWGAGATTFFGKIFAFFAAGAGKIAGVTVGTGATVVLGPIFIISAVALLAILSGTIVSMFKKGQLQKNNLIDAVRGAIKKMFNEIRHNRIPYLRKEKVLLIKELEKQFNKIIKDTEKNLADALAKQKSQTVNKQLHEKRQALLIEYSKLEQYAIEVVE